MSGNKYLTDLLASQKLDERSSEWAELDKEAADIERIIRKAYPNSRVMFTHGGSRAKGTIIREDYDLDEVCYFENEDTAPGQTLEEIYENIADLLAEHYKVRRKRSALRLSKKEGGDLRVDVVPGRYVDATGTDVFIHQNEGSNERLKTNIELHIGHVRDSGCTDVIMLAKLWRTRNAIPIKTFPLELLVIEALAEDNDGDLEDRWRRVLTTFADDIDTLYVEDPANRTGNDLSHALTDRLRTQLSKVAQNTLDAADEHGWEHVFGKIEARDTAIPRVQILRSAAAGIAVPTKPWGKKK
ncbi:MAG TPA: hypothetical protein PK271_06380 [Hyphomicrobium sp.]|uniref:hypothetical protein n=1 Tax=Hyphomicrobium sp. TaxID=82 RepID=UPI002C2ADF8E|nr:hypothetical protein [Hyphomicrobium sp.]HRN88215.1 hypothetical protein [Hyphomicrobium sp.]